MKISRKDFLITSLAGSAALLFSKENKKRSKLVVSKGKRAEIVKKAIDALGGMKRFIKPKSTVVIKPNMSFNNPPDHATSTNPYILKDVVKLVLEAGASKIIVLDNTLRDPNSCKNNTGIQRALDGLDNVVIFLPKDKKFFKYVKSSKAQDLKDAYIIKEALDADFFINMPVAKSHSGAKVSFGIKNLMGLVYNRKIYHYKMDLHTAIADQLYYIKPDLTILDAYNALLTNGPSGPGEVKRFKTVIASTDPVAVDSYALTLSKWDNRKLMPKDVGYIKKAGERGFGNMDQGNMDIVKV